MRALLRLSALVLLGLAVAAPARAAVPSVGSCVIGPSTQCPKANLSGADLQNADLRGANLTEANLTDANLTGAQLQGANLSSATLDRARFHRANLNGANLNNARGRKTDLSSVLLQHASLRHATLPEVNVSGSQIDLSDLYWASLDHGVAHATNFGHSNLDVARMRHLDAAGAHFQGARVTTADFTSANLAHTNFTHANFHATVLTHARATGALLWPSNFDNDRVAIEGLYVRVDGHINAYAGHGGCWTGVGESGYQDQAYSDSTTGTCSGTAEGSGSFGFHNGQKATWAWTGLDADRHLVILGANNSPRLSGKAHGNWAKLDVDRILNYDGVGPTGSRERGQPGGPLALHMGRHDFYSGIHRRHGYSLTFWGWLPRTY